MKLFPTLSRPGIVMVVLVGWTLSMVDCFSLTPSSFMTRSETMTPRTTSQEAATTNNSAATTMSTTTHLHAETQQQQRCRRRQQRQQEAASSPSDATAVISRANFLLTATTMMMTTTSMSMSMTMPADAKEVDPALKGTKQDPAFQGCVSQCLYECTKPKGDEQRTRQECIPECKVKCATTKAQLMTGKPLST